MMVVHLPVADADKIRALVEGGARLVMLPICRQVYADKVVYTHTITGADGHTYRVARKVAREALGTGYPLSAG